MRNTHMSIHVATLSRTDVESLFRVLSALAISGAMILCLAISGALN